MGTENNNLCTIEGNAVPFHCFCSDGTTTTNATKAKCWVFNGLTPEHSLWTLFSTQPIITELNVLVTPMGELNFVPTKGLQYLRELQTLTISYGSVDDIHPYAFANLSKVFEIKLARNRITTLSHHAFAHLANLSVLDLDENRIAELNRDVFVDLPLLKKVYLKQNNLSVIQEGAFRNLGHLIELELSTNALSVLTKDTFAGLGELKKLFLSYNKIVMLGDLTFAELWVLEELDLEANQIEFISDRAFAGLTHLWKLNLSYNKLKTLRSTLLDGVPAIINLDLRHNDLETLTFDNVKPILHNFYNESGYFYLASNKFICDCRLVWMHTLRNETKNQLIRETLDDLTCHLEMKDDHHEPATSLFSTKSGSVDTTLLDDEDPSLNPLNSGPVEDEYSDDLYYDDEDDYQQQQSSQQNQVTISQPDDPYLRHLFQIPVSELPCMDESKPSTQTPRPYVVNTPAYAEINANRCSTTTANILTISILGIISFLCLT
ncbi:hypothetical protein FQR65_LT10828 [Abscondita terminalis]|nr:hypothetical protein FQR65_LT10828 [Abscondita terminalis]